MVTEKKTKSKRPTKRKEEFSYYIVEIANSEMSYSISLNINKKLDVGPYWEYALLKITGKVLYPEKIINRMLECTIRGDREQVGQVSNPLKYDDYCPKGVGFMDIRKNLSTFYGWVPFDVLPHICQLVHLGGIKYLTLYGKALYRNKADIHSICFEKSSYQKTISNWLENPVIRVNLKGLLKVPTRHLLS